MPTGTSSCVTGTRRHLALRPNLYNDKARHSNRWGAMKQAHLEVIDQNNHSNIVMRVRQAVVELQASSKRISFYAVAKKAAVARSTLYRCDDLRLIVETARAEHAVAHSPVEASGGMADAQLQIAELARMLAEERKHASRLERKLESIQPIRYAVLPWEGVA